MSSFAIQNYFLKNVLPVRCSENRLNKEWAAGTNIKKGWWTLCHWVCHVQFEYSWEDKQYLGTCEFLSQPPDCRSRSPSLNQLQSEWLKSDPTKKKSPQVFSLIHCQEFFSTTGRVSSQGQGSQDSPSNIVAGKLKCEIMLLMSLRQLASHYLLSEKLEKHMGKKGLCCLQDNFVC